MNALAEAFAAPPPLDRLHVDSGGVWLLDLAALARRLADLGRRTADLPVAWLFPVKTLPAFPVIRAFATAGHGALVSGREELALLGQGGRRVLHGPRALRVSPAELASTDVVIAGSPRQLDDLLARAPTAAIGLRIASTELLGPDRGVTASGWGLRRAELPAALRRIAAARRSVRWLHVHHGSGTVTAADYRRLLGGLTALARELRIGASVFDVGGGQHHRHRSPAALAALARGLAAELPASATLCLEPGAAHFTGTLRFVARVLDARVRGAELDVILDAGAPAAGAADIDWPYAPPAGTPAGVTGLRLLAADGDAEIGRFTLPRPTGAPALEPGDPVILTDLSPYAIARASSAGGVPRPRLRLI